MTSEVVIMNQIGVALAADSAVTVTSGDGHSKIYTSADKLFLLSEGAPVGIMIYGDATLLGVPWETVIKLYRKQLGWETYPTLEEHAEDFIHYLDEERHLFTEEAQEEYVVQYAAYAADLILTKLQEKKDLVLEEDDEAGLQNTVLDELGKTLEEEIENTRKDEMSNGLANAFVAQFEERYKKTIISTPNAITDTGLDLSNDLLDLFVTFTAELFGRDRVNPYHTGVIVAGFGEREHFPSMCSYQIDGIGCNQLVYTKGRVKRIHRGSGAFVTPFAQQDMVRAFMDGVDPHLHSVFEGVISTLFKKVSESLLDELTKDGVALRKKREEKIKERVEILTAKMFQEWQATRKEKYTNPILNIVEHLPKDELAAMAESLVNLTKFKRRVSSQEETVGGPIDVAIITRGDGFVWIKRKHYFNGDLNPRFMSKYSKGRRNNGRK